MKKLIYGLTYINSLEKAELTEMWLQLLRHFNPDCDILLVDTPAELSFAGLVPSLHGIEKKIIAENDPLPSLQRGINWLSFTDNIGHLSLTGKDGWSRAFCRGIQAALANDYDYVAHIEGDILCRLKFDDVIDQMNQHHLGAISTIATKWNFMEIGLIFMQCDYLREVDFLQKYDWRNITRDDRRMRPEHKIHECMQGRLLFELWYGGRDDNDHDHGLFVSSEIKDLYFLTHARRRQHLHQFMREHAPALNWQPIFPDLPDPS
jgi:hypothetical protein